MEVFFRRPSATNSQLAGSQMTELDFTGERFVPGKGDPMLALEHFHRYHFAAALVKGKHVLDVACGEGYGSALLGRTAASVIGVDKDNVSIHHAISTYRIPNVSFRQGDCVELKGLGKRFDAIVSFETLEHLDQKEQGLFLDEVKEVLVPHGLFILSTPEREEYNRSRIAPNEFHRCELTRYEVLRALRDRFQNVILYGQRLLTVSSLWSLSDGLFGDGQMERGQSAESGDVTGTSIAPLYLLALCSDDPSFRMEANRRRQWFFDHRQSERRDELALHYQLVERERDEARAHVQRLEAEFKERSGWALQLDRELAERKEYIGKLQREFEERTQWALSLDQERAVLEQKIKDLESRLGAITHSRGYRLLAKLGLVPK
jgi:SAM-dependent methyltransferase